MMEDYNGHMYWLTAPVQVLIGSDALPAWLRIAVGYHAGGMYGAFENITAYRDAAEWLGETHLRMAESRLLSDAI